jgi:biotin carboxyl carrier protein
LKSKKRTIAAITAAVAAYMEEEKALRSAVPQRKPVKVDDQVKAGDTLLILEAMKMQNNISAPVDGVVKVINFGAGVSVNKGDILAIIA